MPLHSGNCPKWLFPLMKNLALAISELILDEYGEKEFLKRLANPYWFQSLGCVLGFDWHSSGLTTTTTGALKAALKNSNLIAIAGGKGKTSLKAPDEIIELGDKLNLKEKKIQELIRISKLSAKVDNSLIQDNFQLYHHTIFFTKKSWTVIQQGMNNHYARRYHWMEKENMDFTNEPHSGIISDKLTKPLNLTSKITNETKKCSLDLIKDHPNHLKKYIKPLRMIELVKEQKTLFDFKVFSDNKSAINSIKSFSMPSQHFPLIDADLKTLIHAYETKPSSYEDLILIKGMGQKNIRALALISHLIHGTELSWEDPVKYSFAHGGKDGWPFPVDKKKMNENITFLKTAIKDAKLDNDKKTRCLKRLNRFYLEKTKYL